MRRNVCLGVFGPVVLRRKGEQDFDRLVWVLNTFCATTVPLLDIHNNLHCACFH